jgi:hypothetical protein
MTPLVDLAVRRVLESLTAAELAAVAAGRARIDVHPVPEPADPAQLGLYGDPPPAPAPRTNRAVRTPVPACSPAVDVAAAARHINELTCPEAVADYLRDPRFTIPLLKQIARALGPTVLATGRSKAQLQRDIVAGTAGFRSRSAAMSGGAWS